MTSLIRETDADTNQIKPFMPTDICGKFKTLCCSLVENFLIMRPGFQIAQGQFHIEPVYLP
jgi:hypothetical protein